MKTSLFSSSLLQRLSKVTTAALLASTMLAACEVKVSPSDSTVFDLAAINADATRTAAEKAERLALAGEQLVSPTNFIYADELFTAALAIDANNVRARFWKAALAPMMATKGLATRVEPLARKSPTRWTQYRKGIAELKNQPERVLSDFLLDGPKDISDEADIQEFIAAFTATLDSARETMKTLKNEELVLHINDPGVKQAGIERAAEACIVTRPHAGVYSLENCDLSSAYEVRMNRADFEMLQQSIGGYQVYLSLLNSYDLSGVIAKAESSRTNADPEEALNELLSNPRFGKLRDSAAYGVIPSMTRDLIAGFRYAQSVQSELCPQGEHSKVRAGYLFENGLCVESSSQVDSQIRAIETILSGTAVMIPVRVGTRDVPVLVNAGQYLARPLNDVRELLPAQRSSCGNVVAIGDGRFGGLFPNGDLNVLITAQNEQHPGHCLR